jgi:hypothetical protein
VHCIIERVHRVALGVRIASQWCFYSWRLPPPRWLGGKVSVEAHKKIVRRPREVTVRGIVFTPWEPQIVTLVERVIEGTHLVEVLTVPE